MFAKISLLFVVIAVTAPVIFSEDDVDEVIEKCIKRGQEIAKNADKYTRKEKRLPGEPDLSEPQFKEKKIARYEIEKTQIPFECLSNKLKKYNDESLKENEKYKEMVDKCKSKQFQPKCDPEYPYRTHNGSCNNLEHPDWGATLTCANRKTPAYYVGASGFRRSLCKNRALPNPRTISKLYMTSVPELQLFSSSHFIYFGQFLAHDLVDTPVTYIGEKHLECCKNRHWKDHHPQCAPIILRGIEVKYTLVNMTCFNFVRATPCGNCTVGKRSPMNEVTSFIDLSLVYGLDDVHNAALRTNDSGLLRTQNNSLSGELMPKTTLIEPIRCGLHVPLSGGTIVRKKRDLASVPVDEPTKNSPVDEPTKNSPVDEPTKNSPVDEPTKKSPVDEPTKNAPTDGVTKIADDISKHHCFEGGDRRVNQHTILMIYHTVWLRNHNRIAKKLKKLNPHWDDEKLYQEARKINIAMFQIIVFKEYLPHLIGPKHMTDSNLWLGNGTRTKYDPKENPAIWVEFAGAAFRLHTMVDRKISLLTPELRYLFTDTSHLYLGEIEIYLSGLSTWPYKHYTKEVATDLHQYCYKERLGNLGFDLAAVNIQRGRDIGLPGYVDLLRFISHGKIDIKDFDDLAAVMTPEKILLLKTIYCHVRDIDAWIGLNSEIKRAGLRIPETAALIIAHQFKRLKFGDRFYVEHPKHFNDAQLKELLKSSLSEVFCENTKIPHVLVNSIEDVGPTNLLGPCKLIRKMDLSPWKE